MDALSVAVRAEAPVANTDRSPQAASAGSDSTSFKSTLDAQSAVKAPPDKGVQDAPQHTAEKSDSEVKSQQDSDKADDESADDGSEADKAAAAAATLAQMLAGAQPAPAPTGLSAESSIGPAQSADVTEGKTGLTDALPQGPAPTAALRTEAGDTGTASGAFAALATAMESEIKPQVSTDNASEPSEATIKPATAGSTAPSSLGAGALSLFSNPLRQASLTAALEQGPAATLQSPVGSSEWAEELGTRLAVMTAQGDQSGSLRLSPEHLGPLEVQIRMQDDKANVVFGAQHADTRRALEEALPRLRELFAASGLQLGDAGVSREAPRQAQGAWATRTGSGMAAVEAELSQPISGVVTRQHLGLLDTVA